jgi:ATP-dependent helicase/nuclease subunit B
MIRDSRFENRNSSIPSSDSRFPSHSIYTGSFVSLEIRWMEVVAELQQGSSLREINVLVGSNILASYLKRRLAGKGRTVANVRFHTFLDLAGRLAAAREDAAEKPPARPRLSRIGASILLEYLLASGTPEVFEALKLYRGFRDTVVETFRDLRDAGVDPEELDHAVEKREKTPGRRPHLLALAELYRRFRALAGHFYDEDDDFRAAVANVSEPGLLKGYSPLLVYGIYDATGQQSRLLSALKQSLELIYFIPFVDETISSFARPFLRIREEELGTKSVSLPSRPPVHGLDHLGSRGFGLSRIAANGTPLRDDGSFTVVSVPGESRAAAEIVREIFRAVRDGTISGFHEAAVILRHPETDIPIMTEILRLHGIPYFIHGGGRFSERPLAKAVMALSALESSSFSRESVLNAMELVSASLPETSAEEWDVQSWRVLTNDPRFLAGLRSWEAGTEALVGRAQREFADARARSDNMADDVAESGAPSIKTARQRLESTGRLRAAWRHLRHAATDWPAELPWQDWAHYLEQRFEKILGASEDWSIFSSVLDEIGNLQAIERFETGASRFKRRGDVSSDRLRSALLESISSLSYPAGRFEQSGVNLLSTSAARGLRFPLVLIPGLDEGRFPGRLRQDPLLLDSERLWMEYLPLKSARADEERLLFDMAARSAAKRLVLLSSRLDESSDRERIPSQFFLTAAAAIQGSSVTIRDLQQGAIPGFRSVSLDNPAPSIDEVPINEGEIRLRLVTADRGSASRVLRALSMQDPVRLRRPLAYDRARWSATLTGYDGRITDSLLLERIKQKAGVAAGQVSASRIEEYAKCPYYFFLKRILGLEAWEEQGKTEGMDPLERGLGIHSILESFLGKFSGEISSDASRERLLHMLELLACDELEKRRPGGMPDLLWEVERDALVAMLKNWLVFEQNRASDGLHAHELEKPFGEFSPEETCRAFRMTAGKHTFDFRGRIDRIDMSTDGKRARVIDYKTGILPAAMAGKNRTPLMAGERIQLAIYRGALSVLEEFKDVETADGEYLHLQPKDGQIKPCAFTDEELEEALGKLPDILEILAEGIEGGVFFARTSGRIRPAGHCEYCEYLQVCGKDRMQREARKENDPAVRNFLRILEVQ